MIKKSVYSNQPIEKVSAIALEIFNAWVSFAKGEGTTPFGYSLKKSYGLSGRYASSLSFHVYGRVEFIQQSTKRSGNQGRETVKSMAGKSRSKEYNQVVFQADDSIAPEARVLEYGRGPVDLKKIMLASNYKVTKDGYRERIIPIKTKDAIRMAPSLDKEIAQIGANKKSFSSRLKKEANAMRDRINMQKSDIAYRIMSDKPGSAEWKLPAMMPHNVIGQFTEQLRRRLGGVI